MNWTNSNQINSKEIVINFNINQKKIKFKTIKDIKNRENNQILITHTIREILIEMFNTIIDISNQMIINNNKTKIFMMDMKINNNRLLKIKHKVFKNNKIKIFKVDIDKINHNNNIKDNKKFNKNKNLLNNKNNKM